MTTCMDIYFFFEGDNALAIGANFCDAAAYSSNVHCRPKSRFFSRPNETFPLRRAEPLQEKKFDLAIIGKSPRGEHSRVIQNEKISCPQEILQLNEFPMFDALLLPMQNEHARIFASGQRPHGDEISRQIVIVIG